MPMANNAKSITSNSDVVRNKSSVRADMGGSSLKSIAFSGATASPAKTNVSRWAIIRNDLAVRTEKAVASHAALKVEAQFADIQLTMYQILKSHPPLSPDDVKRQQYLMSISSIREQFLKMTTPAPQSAIPASGMWKDLFKGIDIPQLAPTGPDTASDAQVQSAFAEVTDTRTTLAQRRVALVQQTIPASTLDPEAAVLLSAQVGQQLAATGGTMSAKFVGELQKM